MAKVYELYLEYEEVGLMPTCYGVFTSREKAEEALKEASAHEQANCENPESVGDYGPDMFYIREVTLDELQMPQRF